MVGGTNLLTKLKFKNWRPTRWNGVTMYTVTYLLLKVWTQHHFVPVPRHWFPGTKCGQPVYSFRNAINLNYFEFPSRLYCTFDCGGLWDCCGGRILTQSNKVVSWCCRWMQSRNYVMQKTEKTLNNRLFSLSRNKNINWKPSSGRSQENEML